MKYRNLFEFHFVTEFSPLSSEEPYRGRIRRIREKCSEKNFTAKHELENKKTFKYIDKLKLVMCETPKVSHEFSLNS